ncbi:hypothetical protein HO173_002897 [Letharia columbiana]|uniref:Uncharacterized protein n=1 Tax=Letharia columbiana TaxID=112416 RepID=A0A8H6L7W1_9LECA|nr:uncharacterized protein HO173_002897 [Letharia columbiana]KAF6239025.1 hypothetical protein HO173_002897 [Letharia columbiana]
MAPTLNGQYHWVSKFAPPSAQRILSFMTGWRCVLGWQVNIASGGYLVAVQILGIMILNDPSYVFERWHGTFLIIVAAAVAISFNTFFAKRLPLVEGLMLFIHVCGFFAILIPLWVLAPKKKLARLVFTEFQINGGWPSLGLSCLIEITGLVYSLTGPNSAMHMYIRDASPVLPLGMMRTVLLMPSVEPGWDVLLNAISVSFVLTCLLSFMNIGGSVVFNASFSLTVAAFLSSYITYNFYIILKRWRGKALRNPSVELGR